MDGEEGRRDRDRRRGKVECPTKMGLCMDVMDMDDEIMRMLSR